MVGGGCSYQGLFFSCLFLLGWQTMDKACSIINKNIYFFHLSVQSFTLAIYSLVEFGSRLIWWTLIKSKSDRQINQHVKIQIIFQPLIGL